MSRATDTLRGIIAIMVSIFVIVSPYVKIYTLNESMGIGIAFLGLWMLILSYDVKDYSKNESIVYFLLFLMAIVTGIFIYGNIVLFEITLKFWLYLTGLIILISGIIAIFGNEAIEKGAGVLGIILGAIFLILNFYLNNNYYLALILSIWLMIVGVVQFFISYDETYNYSFFRLF